jgi:hypothetical protein
MNRRVVKTAIDVLLLCGVVGLGVTGTGMYLAPTGKIIKETGWTWLGIDKFTLTEIHTYLGFTMIAVTVLHLLLNWRPLKSLLKTSWRSKIEMVTIGFLIAALVGGAFIYSYYTQKEGLHSPNDQGYRWHGKHWSEIQNSMDVTVNQITQEKIGLLKSKDLDLSFENWPVIS